MSVRILVYKYILKFTLRIMWDLFHITADLVRSFHVAIQRNFLKSKVKAKYKKGAVLTVLTWWRHPQNEIGEICITPLFLLLL